MVKMELADLLEIVGPIRLWLQFNLPPAGDKDFESVVKAPSLITSLLT